MQVLLHPFVVQLAFILFKVVCLLIAIAYYTIAERKIMAAIQRRRGPNVVGFWGLLQPLADGLKLIAKEMVIPSHSNSRIFVAAPLVILTLSLISWSIIPFGSVDISEIHYGFGTKAEDKPTVVTAIEPVILVVCLVFAYCIEKQIVNDVAGQKKQELATWVAKNKDNPALTKAEKTLIEAYETGQGTKANFEFFESLTESSRIADVHYGVLVILALSSLTVYGLIIAGWASNSKYAFLGALRSAAQMISYEVAISLVLLPVILMSGSLNFSEIVSMQATTLWFVFPLLPIAIIFFISMIAETNRTPFDLPEAEAELVAGYNVEYSSIIFAMFFLAEYGNMIMMSLLKAILFLGGWSFCAPLPHALVLTLKGLIFCFLFVLVRATFPRYRYDQLMDIGWKIFLPLATGYLLFVVGTLMYFDALPVVNELASEIYSEVQHGSGTKA